MREKTMRENAGLRQKIRPLSSGAKSGTQRHLIVPFSSSSTLFRVMTLLEQLSLRSNCPFPRTNDLFEADAPAFISFAFINDRHKLRRGS